ncbi:hypothetical protein F4804DRAFT_337155 [Jackrogersella minutella]|nr:hypothetical protein F4804DRAFT_337155 [Jackrogersella minutella]
MIPFPKAIEVEKLDSLTYRIDLNDAFGIGTVFNGGYVGSCVLAAAHAFHTSRGHVFPTVVVNLEVKAALPEAGAEWLAVRVTSKMIRDGRFDLDVLVRDVEGETVVLSHHVAMAVSLERNTAERGYLTKAVL